MDALLKDMADVRIISAGAVRLAVGTLYGQEAALCVCGAGKVNAAVYADTMIHRVHPEWMLNLGVAGAVSDRLDIGDIVIAEGCVQHDLDTTAFGDAPGWISGLKTVQIPCDDRLIRRLEEAALTLTDVQCRRGVIATGDQFISDPAVKRRLFQQFGCMVCEMEGAAVAQTCCLHGVPVGVVRAVSDRADASAYKDFDVFARHAAKRSAALVRALLAGI
jgi:adenosylhomocysteine nucleosidase